MTIIVAPPFQFIADADGSPLENGSVYIGTANLNPLIEANRVAAYTDAALSIPVAQPIKTSGGVLVRSGSPTNVYVAGTAYSIVVLDENGQLVCSNLNVQIITNLLDWVNITYDQTAAELAVGVVPTFLYYPVGDIRRYGAVGDGATDDYAAWVAAAAVSGKIVVPPNFNSAIASASLAGAPITLKTGTTIVGSADGTSRITVTGVVACNLFSSIDQSYIKLKGLRIRGNSVATSSGDGLLWYCRQTTSAAAVGRCYRTIFCIIENFKGDYWLRFENQSTTFAMRDFKVNCNTFTSETGNARNGASVGVPSCMVQFWGTDTGSVGLSADIDVAGNNADGTFIKQFCICWQGVSRARIRSNILVNFGTDASISDDCAAYAILVYKQIAAGADPDLISITNNTINGVRSCGIYVVTCNRLTIRGLTCTNQTDTSDGTLPKGAVAINGGRHVRIKGVTAVDCARGVQVNGDPAVSSKIFLSDITVDSTVNAAQALKLSALTGGLAQSIIVDGLTINMTGTNAVGVVCDFGATYGINFLSIRNFYIKAVLTGLNVFAVDASVPNLRSVVFANGEIYGCSSFGLILQNLTQALQHITIDSVVFSGGFGATAYALDLDTCINLDVSGCTFRDITGGTQYAVSASNSQGTIQGIRYQNVAAAQRIRPSGGTDLGRSLPTHNGNQGDFVQNLSSADRDVSNMILAGWQNYNGAAGWRTMFTSTVSPAT